MDDLRRHTRKMMLLILNAGGTVVQPALFVCMVSSLHALLVYYCTENIFPVVPGLQGFGCWRLVARVPAASLRINDATPYRFLTAWKVRQRGSITVRVQIRMTTVPRTIKTPSITFSSGEPRLTKMGSVGYRIFFFVGWNVSAKAYKFFLIFVSHWYKAESHMWGEQFFPFNIVLWWFWK